MKRTEAEQARARCSKATPGPWREHSFSLAYDGDDIPVLWYTIDYDGIHAEDGNRQLIIHSRTDLPAALDMLERAMRLAKLCDVEFGSGEVFAEIGTLARELRKEWEATP